MIVVDFTVLANLLIIGERTPAAQACLRRETVWVAPSLWQFQWCDVLAEHVRSGALDDPEHAVDRLDSARWLVRESHAVLDDLAVFELAQAAGLSFAQAAHVWTARQLGATLVTADADLTTAFPNEAVTIEEFGSAQ